MCHAVWYSSVLLECKESMANLIRQRTVFNFIGIVMSLWRHINEDICCCKGLIRLWSWLFLVVILFKLSNFWQSMRDLNPVSIYACRVVPRLHFCVRVRSSFNSKSWKSPYDLEDVSVTESPINKQIKLPLKSWNCEYV